MSARDLTMWKWVQADDRDEAMDMVPGAAFTLLDRPIDDDTSEVFVVRWPGVVTIALAWACLFLWSQLA